MSDQAAAECTVVICAHTRDRFALTLAAVASAVRQSARPASVVVVVDHADDLARDLAARVPVGVEVWRSTGPRGLSGARNTAIERATTPIVAFLDDDATAEGGWLEALQVELADPGVHAVGGRAVPRWEVGARPAWFPAEFDWVIGCTHRGGPTRRQAVRNVIGCNMVLRVASMRAIAGFATDIGRDRVSLGGGEETELCMRLRARFGPQSVVFTPTGVVHHHVAAVRGTARYFLRRCRDEGRSKRLLASRADLPDPLGTERRYVTHVLAPGILGGLLDIRGWRTGGPARAAAMAAGFTATVVGYVIGSPRGVRA